MNETLRFSIFEWWQQRQMETRWKKATVRTTELASVCSTFTGYNMNMCMTFYTANSPQFIYCCLVSRKYTYLCHFMGQYPSQIKVRHDHFIGLATQIGWTRIKLHENSFEFG